VNKGAWHGDASLKEEVVKRMEDHRREDSIEQGFYQRVAPDKATGFRGCLIGCTLPAVPDRWGTGVPAPLNGGWHGRVETEYGIPVLVGRMLDQAFELILPDRCADFATLSIGAIAVGADLSMVPYRVLLDILADGENGIRHILMTDPKDSSDFDAALNALDTVIGLYQRRLSGKEPETREWDLYLGGYWRHSALDGVPGYAGQAAWYAAQVGRFTRRDGHPDHPYSSIAAATRMLADYQALCRDTYGRAAVHADRGIHWVSDRILHHLAYADIPSSCRPKIR